MPKKAPAPQSETTTKATPAVGESIDWSAYRRTSAATPEVEEQQEQRAQRPRAHWSDLVGIEGLTVIDAFENSGDFGPYTACVVRLPKVGKSEGKEVIVFGGHNTTAGKQAHAFYTSVEFNDDGSIVATPVSARARPTVNPETGESMNARIMLTFG